MNLIFMQQSRCGVYECTNGQGLYVECVSCTTTRNPDRTYSAPVAMQFARLFFQDRLYELRDAILAKETEFKYAKTLIGLTHH